MHYHNLETFIALIAGISLVPTFADDLVKIVCLSVQNYYDRKVQSYYKKRKNKIITNFGEQDGKHLKVVNAKIKIIKVSMVSEYENFKPILYKRFEDETRIAEKKMKYMFLMNFIFYLGFLIFVPILKMFLNYNDIDFIFIMYGYSSFLIYLVFQIILKKCSSKKVFFIYKFILTQIISIVIMTVLLLITFSGILPTIFIITLNENIHLFLIIVITLLLVLIAFFPILTYIRSSLKVIKKEIPYIKKYVNNKFSDIL